MGLAWAVRRPTEKPVSTAKRLAPVRELAKYMLRKGVDAYVIPDEFVKQPEVRYAPLIFTDKESFTSNDAQCRPILLRHF